MVKKKISKIIICAVLVLVVIAAIGAALFLYLQKRKPDSSAAGATEKTVKETVEDKPAIKEKKTRSSDKGFLISEYDREGNLLVDTFYNDNDEVKRKDTYTYDAKKNLCSKVTTDSEGKQINYEKTVYDNDGNVLEKYEGDNEDSLILKRQYVYKDGRLISDTYYYVDGDVDYDEYDYDDAGLLIEKRHIDPEDGYIYRRWTYEYSDEGKLIEMKDAMYDHVTIEYYDEKERVVLEEFYSNEVKSGYVEYKYNEYGLEEDIQFDADGSEVRHNKTVYDDKGLKKAVLHIDEDGSEIITSAYEYDDSGNLLHSKGMFSEYTAEYNEYGYPTKIHNVNNDPTRDALPYDITEEYEYTYY